MKVLILNGSPHKDGSVFTAINELSVTLNAEGVETEIIHVGSKAIRGCIACRQCTKLGKCAFDDEVNEIAAYYAKHYGLLEFAGSDNHVGRNAKKLAGMCSDVPISSEAEFVDAVKNGRMQMFSQTLIEECEIV